jgi:hypothetical protein
MTCVKYRANGKPFPTLPRLLRHVREKHMPSSGKKILYDDQKYTLKDTQFQHQSIFEFRQQIIFAHFYETHI